MTSIARALALGVMLAWSANGEVVAEKTTSGLDEAIRSFVLAFNNLEWDQFRKSFSNDATVFFPFGDTPRRVSGREQIEIRFSEFFSHTRATTEGPPFLHIDPAGTEIQMFDDIAIVTFHLRSEPRLNRRTLVFRYESGQWLIEHLHASVMTAPGDE